MTRHLTLPIVLAVALLGGCSETSLPKATGKGSINAINAMPASPSVGFLIEERLLGSIDYKQELGAFPFDDLSYNFNFDFLFPGDSKVTRIATQFIDVVADTDYTLLLTGSINAPVLTMWELAEREWSGTETVFEVAFAHLSATLGDVDVYLLPTGTAPVLGEERAKIAFGDRNSEVDLEEGQYQIIVTVRDDPATIIYQSYDTFFAARTSYTLALFDADPSITGNISVRSLTRAGVAVELPDANFPPTLNTIHAAFGTENIDIYADEDFTAPIFSDLGFGESTGNLAVNDGVALYTYTPVGNPGVIINEESQLVPRGGRIATVLAGLPGSNLDRIILTEKLRSLETHAKLRLVHAAANFPMLDLYLVDAGTDITDILPTIPDMPFAFASDFQAQAAGSYDLILTLPDEKDPIAPVLALDLAEGDVVSALIMDTVDPAVGDIGLTRY